MVIIARSSDQECVELPIRNLQDSLDIVLLRHKYYSANNREKEFLQFLKKIIVHKCIRC